MTSPTSQTQTPLAPPRSKKVRRRLAKAEAKLKEQMTRLAIPGNALQRTLALYQAACKYECVIRPPLPEGMRLEPVYLPRPAKPRLDRFGNPKLYPEGRRYWGNGVPGAFGRSGQVKMKPDAYRLVEYRLVPKNAPIAEPEHGKAPAPIRVVGE